MGGKYIDASHIWQAGIDLSLRDLCGTTTVAVNPWYENYPSAPVYLNAHFSASVGDWLRVTVWANGSQSSYQLYDLTTGGFYGGTVAGSPPDDSAEWIEEDPNCIPGPCATMADTANFLFASPTVTVTCSPTTCVVPGNSFVLPLLAIDLAETNPDGGGAYATQKVMPSIIASNLTAFTEIYS